MDIEGDLAAVFDTAIFGTSASLRAESGGTSYQVDGVFDAAHQAVATAGSVDVALTEPRFMASTSSLPAGVSEGWTLKVNSRSYVVRVVEPDGTGVTTLVLQAA